MTLHLLGVVPDDISALARAEARQVIAANDGEPYRVSFSRYISHAERHEFGIMGEEFLSRLLGMQRHPVGLPVWEPDLDGWLEIKTTPVGNMGAFNPETWHCYVDSYCCEEAHFAVLQTVLSKKTMELWSVGWMPGLVAGSYPRDAKPGHESRHVIPMSDLYDTTVGLPELLG